MDTQNNQKGNEPNFYNLFSKVGGIEGRLDTIERNLNRITANHELRINSVERTTDQIVGKASLVSSLFGFVGGIVISLMSHFIK